MQEYNQKCKICQKYKDIHEYKTGFKVCKQCLLEKQEEIIIYYDKEEFHKKYSRLR